MATITRYEIHGTILCADALFYPLKAGIPQTYASPLHSLEMARTQCMLLLNTHLGSAERMGFRNTECDYSSAYISLFTEDEALVGYGQVSEISVLVYSSSVLIGR